MFFLYLTDKATFMIISGGVNIYLQEIEDAFTMHPKIDDIAVFGVPNEEMGEEVKAVVQPAAGVEAGDELAAELMAYTRAHVAHYKCPKSIDFDRKYPACQPASCTSDCSRIDIGARKTHALSDAPHFLVDTAVTISPCVAVLVCRLTSSSFYLHTLYSFEEIVKF